jgi:hypothetical protein
MFEEVGDNYNGLQLGVVGDLYVLTFSLAQM